MLWGLELEPEEAVLRLDVLGGQGKSETFCQPPLIEEGEIFNGTAKYYKIVPTGRMSNCLLTLRKTPHLHCNFVLFITIQYITFYCKYIEKSCHGAGA